MNRIFILGLSLFLSASTFASEEIQSQPEGAAVNNQQQLIDRCKEKWGCAYRGTSYGQIYHWLGYGRTKEDACAAAKNICDQRPARGGNCYYGSSGCDERN